MYYPIITLCSISEYVESASEFMKRVPGVGEYHINLVVKGVIRNLLCCVETLRLLELFYILVSKTANFISTCVIGC